MLLVLVALGAGPTSLSMAQATAPAYDHPLFTGPAHETPTPRFDQEHLRLALRFDEARRRVFGDATLRLTPLDTLADTLSLFAAGLAIDSVQFGALDSAKVDVPFRLGQADSLLIALDTLRVRQAPFEVRIVYSAQPRRGLYFIQPSKNHPNQKRQIWTSNAPEESRHWFPVFDFPGDKLTSELLVTVEEPLRVLSNGRLVEQATNDDGTITSRFVQDQPHAPHLVMLTAGDYEIVRERVRPSIGRPIPLSYWVYPEHLDDTARTFGRTPDMMRFFAEHLRVPFPWESYGQVVLRQFHAGGMANTGAATLSDRVVIDERAALDDHPDGLIAHELAHQWFGTLVTARYWDDVWLDEGFASYLSALFEEHHAGEDALALRLLTYADHYQAEARQYRRPLVWNRWDDPAQMFDAHSSWKGAWVLHMLRRRLGDALFWKVLEQHLTTYAFKPVETADFRRVLRSVTGERFDDFFAQWVDAAGHPVLDVRYSYDAEEGTLALTVEQVQEGFRVPDVFRTDLTLEVHALTEAFRFDVTLSARRQTFRLPLPMRPRFLLVDPDGDLLAEVRVDQPARAWVGQLRYAPHAVPRIRAARALATSADDPALLVGLRSALREEPVAAVRTVIVETIGRFSPSSAVQRALAESLGDEDAAVRGAALDALGAFENVPEVHTLAFQTAQNDSSYRVQASAVKTLARTASPSALDVVRSALITPSHRDVIRQAALEALALLDLPLREGLALGLEYSAINQPGEVRIAALGYLQTLTAGSRAALNRLIDLLEDDDVGVRRATIDGLAVIDSERARAALQRRLATEPQPLLKATLEQAVRQATSSNQ
ncbi:MAG: HEAT repeat domain-containing protein [Bacteroidetes bacterium]|nr:HEAT repeat domain-containing protein [Bacteroidota bacterium]